MFCPNCGLEERQTNQFCRACGADLRVVRSLIERPDSITASAATAREEIGRAFASKIREADTAVELKIVAEDVLPQIEKFLESPAEKRLRRVRTGTLITCIGLGAAIGFFIAAALTAERELVFLAGLGIVAFFVGIGFLINGLLFTTPKKLLSDNSDEARTQRAIDSQTVSNTNELQMPEARAQFIPSVTEHTTRHLKK